MLSIPPMPIDFAIRRFITLRTFSSRIQHTGDRILAEEAPANLCQSLWGESQLGLSIYKTCERSSDVPNRWLITWSASVRALTLCSLLVSIFGVSCHEEVTVLIMLLAKLLHCLLVWSVNPCGRAVVLRSQVGLGELGRVRSESSGPLETGAKEEVRASYGMLTAVIETRRGREFSNNQRLARHCLIGTHERADVLVTHLYDLLAHFKSFNEACNHFRSL